MRRMFSFIGLAFLFWLMCFDCTDVFAASLSIDEGDYQLECIYNGVTLTIAKSGVYMINNSIEVSENSKMIKKAYFHLTPDQESVYENDKLVSTNYDKLTNMNGGCPLNLYLLKNNFAKEGREEYYISTEKSFGGISKKVWENMDQKKKNDLIESCVDWKHGPYMPWNDHLEALARAECNNRNSTYYQLHYNDKATDWLSEVNISLKSEEIYLTTNKTTTICDYATNDGDTVSIYNYANVSILEMKDKSTVLDMKNFKIEVDGKEKDIKSVGTGYLGCPAHLTTKEKQGNNPGQRYLFVNNPFPKDVIGSVDTTYNNVRFYAFESANKSLVPYAQKACKQLNNGQDCIFYEYIGSRNGIAENDTDVCDLLGNNVIIVLLKILGWLQILVPVIVIVLTAIDIVKMVLAGNIEEELPKKRKLIIIRVIVMVVFFFIPLIARLISVSIYGENLNECIYSDGSNSGNNNIVDNDNKVPSGNGGSNSNKNTTTVVN